MKCSSRLPFAAAVMAALLAFVTGNALAADSLKITVFGGTGNIGSRIVAEALRRGHEVTVISRDPARAPKGNPRLSAKQGDVLDSQRVAELAKGQDIVISAVGAGRADPDYDVYRKAAESLVKAMRTLGDEAPRLLVVGGAGSLQVAPGVLFASKLPEAIRPELMGQMAALDYYRTVSDVKWTYFSPAGRIAPGERTGKFRLGGDRLVTDANGESRISMEDYAVAMIDEAERAQHVGRRFTIGY